MLKCMLGGACIAMHTVVRAVLVGGVEEKSLKKNRSH